MSLQLELSWGGSKESEWLENKSPAPPSPPFEQSRLQQPHTSASQGQPDALQGREA